MSKNGNCINCGRKLSGKKGVRLCPKCNVQSQEYAGIFKDDFDDGYVFITCPGATLYKPGTNEILCGARFNDNDDGYVIVDHPVYAPNHKRRRRIKKDAVGKIRRCQACQDYTIRMRRKEGEDFFIPSHKYPGRKKLKSVEHLNYEP